MTREANPFDVARDVRARAALVYHRISARSDELVHTPKHRMRVGPGIVRLHSGWRHSASKPGGGARGPITAFTEGSRRRMEIRFRESEWPMHRLLLFVTLTWPGFFSADPQDWKRALRAWIAAYERAWGPLITIWVLEFQLRGAPHFHLAIAGPKGVSIEEMRAWNAETWYRIAGHGDERHLRQHQKPGHCKKARSVNELLGYLQKELRKSRQKELPAWLTERDEGAGRWWGMRRLPNVAFNEPTNRTEYRALHRRGRRLLRPRTRKLYIRGTRYVMRPRKTSHDPWSEEGTGQHWIAAARRTKTLWRPDSRWIVLRDRSPRPWSLSQAFYNLLLLVRGKHTAKSSYARWDDIAGVQLHFPDDPFAALAPP